MLDPDHIRHRKWYTDARVVVVLLHTAVVTTFFAVDYHPSHDTHINPCCWIVDFPAIATWYYLMKATAWVTGIPFDRLLNSALSQFIAIVFFGGLQWFLVAWRHVVYRRPKPAKGNLCRKCQYNLTGNVSGVCPECGTPIDRRDAGVTPPPASTPQG